jgi:hypothetical protein
MDVHVRSDVPAQSMENIGYQAYSTL